MTQKTTLYEEHQKLNARMVEFAGFWMPVQYSGLVDEHHAVRNDAGLFDVSHMGEFLFEGPNAFNLLQYLTANDVSKLEPGKAQYSLLCNQKAGVVDDILLYQLESQKYLMVVNAANIAKDYDWVTKHKSGEVNIKNVSAQYSLLALQGPGSKEIAKKLTSAPIDDLSAFRFLMTTFAGADDCIVSATGYTGEQGYEIYVSSEKSVGVWQEIFKASTGSQLKPVGLGARDTLRLEARLSLYGHEITDEINPLEAGLGWVVKLKKEIPFIGSQALLKIKDEGLSRVLAGFEMLDRGVPRQGYKISDGEHEIGFVTSGSHSPTLNKSIGLGFLPVGKSEVNNEIYIDVRGKLKLARVIETPFYKRLPV